MGYPRRLLSNSPPPVSAVSNGRSGKTGTGADIPASIRALLLPVLLSLLAACDPGSPPDPGAPVAEAPTISVDGAVARGDLQLVKQQVAGDPARASHGLNPNLPPLASAILRRHLEIAQFLIGAGADVQVVDGSGRTLAHLAVERGLADIIAPLAEAGANLDLLDGNGWSPLHWAAAKNDLAVARALVEAGADTQVLSARGGTILHEAAATGSGEMVRFFLQLGVDPSRPALDGNLALDIAREFDNGEAIRLLE